jgi:hypothetical protein
VGSDRPLTTDDGSLTTDTDRFGGAAWQTRESRAITLTRRPSPSKLKATAALPPAAHGDAAMRTPACLAALLLALPVVAAADAPEPPAPEPTNLSDVQQQILFGQRGQGSPEAAAPKVEAPPPPPPEAPPPEAAKSRPAVPGPFRFWNVNGERAGKAHDPVSEIGLSPFVAVIARDLKAATPDSPLGHLLAQLDATALPRPRTSFGAFAVFPVLKADLPFDEERDGPLKALDEFAKSVKLGRVVVGVTRTDDPALAAWGVTPDAVVTVLVVTRLRVVDRYVFTADKPLSDEGVKTIVARVAELLPRLPPERPNRGRRPAAPADAKPAPAKDDTKDT